jgi:hypothetical protein
MTAQFQPHPGTHASMGLSQERLRSKRPESVYRRVRYELSKTWARVPLLRYRHRGFQETDVFFASYPRSGSTWSRFTLFEILTGEEASFDSVNRVLRGVGTHSLGSRILPGGGRLIATHESYRAEYKKAVYLVRDGRDVLLSEYAYLKALGRFRGGLDDFVSAFVLGKVNGFGAWPVHVSSWLNSPIAGTPNMLLVRFEDIRSNPERAFSSIVEFLGLEVESEVVSKAIAKNSLEKMRIKEDRSPQRASVRGRFIRSGSVQSWRTELSCNHLQAIEVAAGVSLRRLGYALGSVAPNDVRATAAQIQVGQKQSAENCGHA